MYCLNLGLKLGAPAITWWLHAQCMEHGYTPTPHIVAAPKNLDTIGKNGKCSKFSEMARKWAEQVLGMFDTGI